jgi:hypothetical protein
LLLLILTSTGVVTSVLPVKIIVVSVDSPTVIWDLVNGKISNTPGIGVGDGVILGDGLGGGDGLTLGDGLGIGGGVTLGEGLILGNGLGVGDTFDVGVGVPLIINVIVFGKAIG